MSRYRDNSIERVRAALTIKRFGETDKPFLELVREQRQQ